MHGSVERSGKTIPPTINGSRLAVVSWWETPQYQQVTSDAAN